MALQPVKVATILLGLVLIWLGLELAEKWGNLRPLPAAIAERPFAIAESVLETGRYELLLALFGWFCVPCRATNG